MRGVKQTSQDQRQRIKKNLDALVEDPHRMIPEYRVEFRKGRRDALTKGIADIEKVIGKRHDRRWLVKRMKGKRLSPVARAYAGAFVAAGEDDHELVSSFRDPFYGASSYVRRGDGQPLHQVGVQNHLNRRLRLLAWEEFGRKGFWFFSTEEGVVCTGKRPHLPEGWVPFVLEKGPLPWKLKDDSEQVWTSGKGVTPEQIIDDEPTIEGLLKVEFNDGTTIGFSRKALTNSKAPLVNSIASMAMPPKMIEFTTPSFLWVPNGWPKETPLPDSSLENVERLLEAWMGMAVTDEHLWPALKEAALAGIDEGLMLRDRWFPRDEVEDFLSNMSGSDLERKAAIIVLDSLEEEGIWVREKGEPEWLEKPLVRLADESLHTFLLNTWEEYGLVVLENLFDVSGDEAEGVWERQLEKRSGFGSFFRKLVEEQQERVTLARFPWPEGELSDTCGAIEELVRTAHLQTIGKAHSKAKKMGKDIRAKSVGWGWLALHRRESGEEWHFEQTSRELGNDWLIAIEEIWKASEEMLVDEKPDEGARGRYVKAMKDFHKISGSQAPLTDPI